MACSLRVELQLRGTLLSIDHLSQLKPGITCLSSFHHELNIQLGGMEREICGFQLHQMYEVPFVHSLSSCDRPVPIFILYAGGVAAKCLYLDILWQNKASSKCAALSHYVLSGILRPNSPKIVFFDASDGKHALHVASCAHELDS